MINNAVLLDKGIKCLNEGLGLLEAEQFIYVLLSQPFDYTEWRKKNLFVGCLLKKSAMPRITIAGKTHK